MSASSFLEMKKNRKKNKDKLLDNLKGNSNKYQDDRMYYPERDKAGNGQAVIRFLPPSRDSKVELPYVNVFNHGFRENGRWFIENCPTTVGKPCPVCEKNRELWGTNMEENKNIARNRKRKKSYIANILVVKDPANPENEGKVFLFKFGVKIFEKIQSAAAPIYEGEDPIDVFDFWDGANFRLKIRKLNGMTNYDDSSFDSVTPLNLDGGTLEDEEIEKIWKSQYDLHEFVSDEQFKSYDDLSKKFTQITGAQAPTSSASEEETPVSSIEDKLESRRKKKVDKVEESAPSEDSSESPSEDDSDDYFQSLMEELDD